MHTALSEVLAENKGGTARNRLKEVGVQNLRAITKIHGKNEDNLQDMQGLRQKFPLLSRK